MQPPICHWCACSSTTVLIAGNAALLLPQGCPGKARFRQLAGALGGGSVCELLVLSRDLL